MIDFFLADWLGTPLWFWAAFLAIVIILTAFDLVFRRDGYGVTLVQ